MFHNIAVPSMGDISYTKLKPQMVDTILYRANNDGFGAAFAAWKYIKDIGYTKDMAFWSYTAGNESAILNLNLRDKNILICGLSLTYEILHLLRIANQNILEIDHRIPDESNLDVLAPDCKLHSTCRSTCYLTWCFFHSENNVPDLILGIEDQYLKNKSFLHNEAFNAAVNMFLVFDFEEWNSLLVKTEFEVFLEKGKIIQLVEQKQIHKIASYTEVNFCQLLNKTCHIVATVYSNVYQEKVGRYILNMYPYINFAIVYFYCPHNDLTTFYLYSDRYHSHIDMITQLYRGTGNCQRGSVSLIGRHTMLPNKFIYPVIITAETNLSIYKTGYIQQNDTALRVLQTHTEHNAEEWGRYLIDLRPNQNYQNIKAILTLNEIEDDERLFDVVVVDKIVCVENIIPTVTSKVIIYNNTQPISSDFSPTLTMEIRDHQNDN